MWDAWKAMFLQCFDKHAPLRVKRTRAFRSPWITPELKKRMHDIDIPKLKASKSKDASDWRRFKQSRNQLNIDIRLQSGAKSLLHMRYFFSKFAYQTIKSGKKAFVLLISLFPPSNVALLL